MYRWSSRGAAPTQSLSKSWPTACERTGSSFLTAHFQLVSPSPDIDSRREPLGFRSPAKAIIHNVSEPSRLALDKKRPRPDGGEMSPTERRRLGKCWLRGFFDCRTKVSRLERWSWHRNYRFPRRWGYKYYKSLSRRIYVYIETGTPKQRKYLRTAGSTSSWRRPSWRSILQAIFGFIFSLKKQSRLHRIITLPQIPQSLAPNLRIFRNQNTKTKEIFADSLLKPIVPSAPSPCPILYRNR